METFPWPGCAANQQGAPKVAVLVPGSGYKVESPLLYWPAELLKDRGWQVYGIRWTDGDEPGDDPHGFAARAVERAFAAAPSAIERLIVAKSFGTFAIPWAKRPRCRPSGSRRSSRTVSFAERCWKPASPTC